MTNLEGAQRKTARDAQPGNGGVLVNLSGAFLATMTVIYAVVAFVGVALTFGLFLVWIIG